MFKKSRLRLYVFQHGENYYWSGVVIPERPEHHHEKLVFTVEKRFTEKPERDWKILKSRAMAKAKELGLARVESLY